MVNTTYINNATGFWDWYARFSTETGYIYSDAFIMLIFLYAAYRSSNYGAGSTLVNGALWGLIVSTMLYFTGLTTITRPVMCFGLLALGLMMKKFME